MFPKSLFFCFVPEFYEDTAVVLQIAFDSLRSSQTGDGW